MKFTKIFVAAYALMASVGSIASTVGPTPAGTPIDDLALLGLAVAALAGGVGIIRRKK